MLQNKKLLILIGLFILVLVITFVFYFLSMSTSNPNSTPSPTPTTSAQQTPIPFDTPVVQGQQPIPSVDFTGVSSTGNDLPPDQQKQVNEAFDLRQKLPIKQADFTITYDYATDHFMVSLKQPTSESQKTFDAWRAANGFESIPTTSFQFQSL